MATKRPTKSRTSQAKSSGFQFRWWMAAGLVAVVAVVGILVLRFSQASSNVYTGRITGNYYGTISIQSYNAGVKAGVYTYKPILKDLNGLWIYQDITDGRCMYITPNNGGVVGSIVAVQPSLCSK